jgi:hypothetical protein
VIQNNSLKDISSSLDGLYFYNESNYYAIEGTEVNYGCQNTITHILVSKESTTCTKNGLWSSSQPYCYGMA